MALEIQTKMEKDLIILRMNGVLDISTVELLRNSVKDLSAVKKLVFDFEKIKFIDSTGVGSIAKIIRECQQKELSIKVNNILPEVFEVLDILGLPEIFGEETFERKFS